MNIVLTRRNLIALLAKLDLKAEGIPTICTIIKYDPVHPVYPNAVPVTITAVDDNEYYIDRKPGIMTEATEERIKNYK